METNTSMVTNTSIGDEYVMVTNCNRDEYDTSVLALSQPVSNSCNNYCVIMTNMLQ